MRGGHNHELESAQLRFSDPSTDLIVRDVDELRRRYATDPTVNIALAAHSIRAVPLQHVGELAAYAAQQAMPFHMHVCEQRRELDECRFEYGTTPVQLLSDNGILSPRFVGVHATHLTHTEIEALGDARSSVCLCRTTERDLGDGLPKTSALVAAGVRLCVGVDSHACENAFEEVRALELDERSRLEVRHAAADAVDLLDAATRLGYVACGLTDGWAEDVVYLRVDDASIAGVDEGCAIDAIIFAATPRAVDKVVVDGQVIVREGRHLRYEEAHQGYVKTLQKLDLLS